MFLFSNIFESGMEEGFCQNLLCEHYYVSWNKFIYNRGDCTRFMTTYSPILSLNHHLFPLKYFGFRQPSKLQYLGKADISENWGKLAKYM